MSTDSDSDAEVPPEIVVELQRLLPKVLFAGDHKHFIGRGELKFSRQEIEGLKISDLGEVVYNLINDEPLRRSSQYTLGLCRIYEKAVDFLLEDLEKLDTALNEGLNGVYEALKKPKIPKKGKKGKNAENEENCDAGSIRSPELCEEGHLISLFRQRDETDRNLLQEFDNRLQETDTLGLFGDEIHLQDQVESYVIRSQRFAQVNGEMQTILANDQMPNQIVVEAEIHEPAAPERSIASTPKRKTRKPHEDTPKKRQRQHSPSQPDADLEEINSVPRRLFGRDDQRSLGPADERFLRDEDNIEPVEQSFAAPANENVLVGETENESRPLDERMPLPAIDDEARRISELITRPDTVPDLEEDREQPPAEVPENVPNLPNETLQSDDMELEQLDDETIADSTSKRRRRPKQVFDRKKKTIEREIDISDLENEKYVTLHTKPRGAIRLVNQVSSKNLFLMPAVGLKPGGSSSYGATLLKLYRDSARSLLDFTHDDLTLPRSPLPRDAHVNKRPRFSSFGRGSRPRVSTPSTPAGEPNVQLENDGGYHADPDRELMPPPPPLLTPALPSLTQEPSPQPQAPGTPKRRATEPDFSAVSPRRLIPTINITEPAMADEPPLGHFDFQGSVIENPDLAAMSPRSTASERERRTLMKENEFTSFIESFWVRGSDIIDLEMIIPRGVTVIAFHRYFTFLQRLQRNRKLRMEQEVIYGPVNIIRETGEEEDEI